MSSIHAVRQDLALTIHRVDQFQLLEKYTGKDAQAAILASRVEIIDYVRHEDESIRSELRELENEVLRDFIRHSGGEGDV